MSSSGDRIWTAARDGDALAFTAALTAYRSQGPTLLRVLKALTLLGLGFIAGLGVTVNVRSGTTDVGAAVLLFVSLPLTLVFLGWTFGSRDRPAREPERFTRGEGSDDE